MARRPRFIEQSGKSDAEYCDELVATIPKPPRTGAPKSIINTATRSDADKQRIATPWAFIHALEHRFGTPVDFDLAADVGNAKAPEHFDDEGDALKQDWSRMIVATNEGGGPSRLAYLNPPFANIRPWALGPKGNPKAGLLACRWLPRWTVMLVPASYSTDWFLELRGKVQLDAIPRIQFEGAEHLYPKDLVLCVAGFGVCGNGYWDWRASYVMHCRAQGRAPDPVHLKGVRRLPQSSVMPDLHWSPDPFTKEPDWSRATQHQPWE